MSLKSDKARLERVSQIIEDVYEIIDRHETIEKALKDKEGQYALLMCISQIGEIISKLEADEIVQRLPVKEANAMRNVIIHNYEGVSLRIMKQTLETSLPELEKTIQAILDEE